MDRFGDPLPADAVARLGTLRLRGVVAHAFAFAADGRVVDQNADSNGLLAIPKDGFLNSFIELTSAWRGAGKSSSG